jgi:hypothetical protein
MNLKYLWAYPVSDFWLPALRAHCIKTDVCKENYGCCPYYPAEAKVAKIAGIVRYIGL